ncbi:CheR family methyltransferase [Aliterella atlantica]|uniref:protein-glutamate O-methyltransferase n=1 Tax=Aliterella atlantica CENA595 TaxID=1618023 RepID=A0A0D8ZSN3_9CYAN|nr:CheR family methyltransferase [Aliterella atlantica]KJH71372.1 hypothetical protein UH38_12475 [Aliterella atlantica CENA595]
MNDQLLQQFLQLIATHTGLHIREQDRENLAKKIYTRMKLLNISSPEHYYQLLNASNGNSNSSVRETPSDREWKELALQLTIGESYFFRDRGQIELLRKTILPKLIEQKRQESTSNQAKPSLRIWSAGCSTGEEVYSLAILVKELIPDIHNWQILLLGTDLNLESINKARRGIYEAWSFRMVDPEIKNNYFNQRQQTWEIKQQIRSLVKFQANNLIKYPFPNTATDIYGMDIIICRNVFIYFDSKSIAIVLDKFYNTLKTTGYLIVGHAELHGLNLGKLKTKVFPQSVVYQRSENEQAEVPAKPLQLLPVLTDVPKLLPGKNTETLSKKYLPQSAPIKSPEVIAPKRSITVDRTDSTHFKKAEILFKHGEYAIAIHTAEQVIKQQPHHFGACYLLAQAWANLGEAEKAAAYCQKAIEIDAIAIAPYYLFAHIAEEKGDIERAKELFKKIIYLEPSAITAYVELGIIYQNEGDNNRSKKMISTARELLKDFPAHTTVQPGENTASELMLYLNSLKF